MKIERLSQDKIRIFLTFDDLSERGIQKEDMWQEVPKVHDLFTEMMDQAYSELGFDATGPLAVEVFALPAQGMVVIVTGGNMITIYTVRQGKRNCLKRFMKWKLLLNKATPLYMHSAILRCLLKRPMYSSAILLLRGNCILITINGTSTSIRRNLRMRPYQDLWLYWRSSRIHRQ